MEISTLTATTLKEIIPEETSELLFSSGFDEFAKLFDKDTSGMSLQDRIAFVYHMEKNPEKIMLKESEITIEATPYHIKLIYNGCDIYDFNEGTIEYGDIFYNNHKCKVFSRFIKIMVVEVMRKFNCWSDIINEDYLDEQIEELKEQDDPEEYKDQISDYEIIINSFIKDRLIKSNLGNFNFEEEYKFFLANARTGKRIIKKYIKTFLDLKDKYYMGLFSQEDEEWKGTDPTSIINILIPYGGSVEYNQLEQDVDMMYQGEMRDADFHILFKPDKITSVEMELMSDLHHDVLRVKDCFTELTNYLNNEKNDIKTDTPS